MSYQLIAIDLDDTLLTSQKTISPRNQEAIASAVKQGIKVVLCSGRTHNATVKFTNTLGIKGSGQYMITNGGGIIEELSGKIISQNLLSNQFYRQFVQFTKDHHLHYNVVDNQGNTYTSHMDWIDRYTIIQAHENDKGLFIKEPDELPNDFQIVKAIINGEKDELDAISDLVHQTFESEYFVVRTGVGFLEVFPKHVNKGIAVKKLAKSLNIALENVMAFGDRDNDIPMFEVAGKAIAMENAQPGPKAASDYITDDNNHDGVAKAIEKFILN